MKIISFVFILVFAVSVFSQTDPNQISIKEGESLNLCGHIVIVDGIWMNEGIIRADISILERPNSKPITGGYIKGDEFKLSDADSCKYYINSITKSGPDSSKGNVILSETLPPEFLQICEDSLVWEERSKYWFDTLDHRVTAILSGDDGKLMAEISVTYKSLSIRQFFLRENEVIWCGECLYKVTNLKGQIYNSMGYEWDIVPGKLVLTRQNFYIHSSNESIEGLENQPNIRKHFVIRKAQLYKGMKPTKEEIENKGPKLWLIEIFFKSRGIASRSMKVMLAGKMVTVEFEPVRTFEDEDEALKYAKENSITDVKLEEEEK